MPLKSHIQQLYEIYIALHKSGDVILDAFCGTGMTGVAAQYCAKPELSDKYLIETEFENTGLKKPIWGERLYAICNDLSPLATFITFFL